MKLLIVILLLPLFAVAAMIDVSEMEHATLRPGGAVAVEFGVWNYGANNPDASPYPTWFGFRLFGTGQTDQAFSVTLESADGSVSVPIGRFTSARASLATDGVVNDDLVVVQGSVHLPGATSHGVFGANIRNYSDAAILRIRNLGEEFQLGLGEGYSMRNAASIYGVRGNGKFETAGVTGRVMLENPEPSTFILWAGGLAAIGSRALLPRRWRRRPGSAQPRRSR